MLPAISSRARSSFFHPSALLAVVAIFAAALAAPLLARGDAETGKKPLTFVDLMKFRTITQPVIAADGSVVAYRLQPDRGDGAVVVVRADGGGEQRIELGSAPQLSDEGRFVLATLVPSLEQMETSKDEKPENGLALLDVSKGEQQTWERVSRAELSYDGRHLAILHTEKARKEAEAAAEEAAAEEAAAEEAVEGEAGEESEPAEASEMETVEAASGEAGEEGSSEEGSSEEGSGEEASGEQAAEDEEEKKEERLGTTLRLIELETGAETEIEHVSDFAFAHDSNHLAYAVAAPGGDNGLFIDDLDGEAGPSTVTASEGARYTAFAWTDEEAIDEQPLFAFVAAIYDQDGEPGDGAVWIWQASSGEGRAVATTDSAPAGSFIPSHNGLAWSRDGQRLFYGTKPRPRPREEKEDDEDAPFDPYDVEALLDEKGVDVWHVDDPLIKTNERAQWNEIEKDRTFLAVYHRGPHAANVQLASGDVRLARPSHNDRAVLAAADVPYLRQRTWEGFFADLYWLSLEDGDRQLVAERLPSFGGDFSSNLSPDGRYVAWYRAPHWYLFDAEAGTNRNLTEGLGVSFADEDHDYPRPADSYGLAGWLDDSSAVLIHDRYDVWSFSSQAAETDAAVNLTAGRGREGQLKLRVVDEGFDRDPSVTVLPAGERILLHGEREREKNHGFWQVQGGELEELVESKHRYRLITRAEDSDRLLFTRESYREFPDLRLSGPDLSDDRRLSNANPQVADFAWGHAELVSFTDADGRASDAVLIRPETLEEGERCPVLVYYYRFFSHRLYSFNEPKVNHRPSFPVYASHGYCVFLPDVRFEVGRPGFSATKALVPAVQKIVDMGIADPDAIGLHGHSWSGYQTAFVVTQTNIFAAAVAGAPVSNMTSAYGGIRYGRGLARLFQYETGQSRIGGSLWEARDLYIENSPLFYVDRIETPIMLQFGDVDEAVPWTQGVELYLALRRLGKDAVFLQYHDEPHHLKKYPNKLDYSMKMKEYFDHYLKGVPAPVWLSEGVPYRGDE